MVVWFMARGMITSHGWARCGMGRQSPGVAVLRLAGRPGVAGVSVAALAGAGAVALARRFRGGAVFAADSDHGITDLIIALTMALDGRDSLTVALDSMVLRTPAIIYTTPVGSAEKIRAGNLPAMASKKRATRDPPVNSEMPIIPGPANSRVDNSAKYAM